ncbi:MAG: heavy metal translocating P-type ATPase, partial [Aggregatilineales bacterium]
MNTFARSKTQIASEQFLPAERPRWLTQAWLEPRFVIVTLAAIVLGALAEGTGLPRWVVVACAVTAYAAGGVFGAKTAIESLRERRIDVDMLMVLAALGAAAIGQWQEGAVLLFLFSLSNVLQDYAIGRSRQAIKSLFKLYPNEARVVRDGRELVVPVDDIQVGELVLIKPGERIPVDGVVRGGRSAVDQSPITGESLPVDKGEGDNVFAGTLNTHGLLDVEATQPASDTTLARIIKLVEEAQDAKAPTERFLDKFEQVYAAGIIGAVLLFIVVPPLLGLVDNFSAHFYTAMVLMTVASPCALIISVPAAFISAIASAARGGVLFKGGAYLEQLAEIKAVAFDKTGTLTLGQPQVTDVHSCCELGDDELLRVAGAVEARGEHPLGRAVVKAAQARGLALAPVEDFENVPGKGITSKVDGREVRLGSVRYLAERNPLPERLRETVQRLEAAGKSVIGVVREGQCQRCGGCDQVNMGDGVWLGVIAVSDQLRPEATDVVAALQERGVAVAMLTGDNPAAAQAIGKRVGVNRVHARLMPADKVAVVQALQADYGPTAMIGDGVNDAPALAMADIGVAMGAAGTDVALETADVVLMGDKLQLIPYAIAVSKQARRVVWQNIAFSLAVIAVLVVSVFAAGLTLPLGVLGHEGSTV